VTLDEALSVLGLKRSADEHQVRSAFHRLMRSHHPDVMAPDPARSAEIDPALITEAYAVVSAALKDPAFPMTATPVSASNTSPPSTPPGSTAVACGHDGDTIWIEAPPDEAYQLLYEATGHLGGVGHVDRNLGLLEIIVRFEGGPSCSVLFTLQGRAHGTDVFCEMESIEAAPTPSIAPVLDAILLALVGSASAP